jgi:hypothetical protein
MRIHLRIHGHNGVLAACGARGTNRIRTDQVGCGNCKRTSAYAASFARRCATEISRGWRRADLRKRGIIR